MFRGDDQTLDPKLADDIGWQLSATEHGMGYWDTLDDDAREFFRDRARELIQRRRRARLPFRPAAWYAPEQITNNDDLGGGSGRDHYRQSITELDHDPNWRRGIGIGRGWRDR